MPEIAQAVRVLAQVALFRGLDRAALADVANAAWSAEVLRGRLFFRQGTDADTIYVLQRGRVKLTQATPEGHNVLLRFISPGEIFGPTAALRDRVYPVSAQAVSYCRALAWKGRTIVNLIENHPRIALNIIENLSAHVEELRERYLQLATERVECRIAHVLLRLAVQAGQDTEHGVRIDMPLSRQDVAEMTGTTLYTVSRILRAWQRQGLVSIGRHRVEILQPQRLEPMAHQWPLSAP